MSIACRARGRRTAEPRRSTRAAGLTLVELMVSLAIGLFLVAVGITLLVAQLRENRGLLIEARLQQDLRTAADLMARDLRREGYWGSAATGSWTPGTGPTVSRNPYQPEAPATAASDATLLRYSRDTVENGRVDGNEQFGYRLHHGTIELQLGAGNWQAITDAGTLTITDLQIVPRLQEILLADTCSRPCPPAAAATGGCPPRQTIRDFAVTIVAHAVADPGVVRSLRSRTRVRNDAVVGACPTA